MARQKVIVMPSTQKILSQMGEQIRLARLRRNISSALAAERAGISQTTLRRIEQGDPTVTMGAYAVALHALHAMDKDLLLIAKDDELIKTLREIELNAKKKEHNNFDL